MNTTATVSPSWLRRWRVPLIAVALPVCIFVLIWLWITNDWEPAAQMPLFMAFQWSVMLTLLVLTIWWLFFAGFRMKPACASLKSDAPRRAFRFTHIQRGS